MTTNETTNRSFDLTTITLGADQFATLKMILEFHAMNDTPEDGYYDWQSFLELCEKLDVEVPSCP